MDGSKKITGFYILFFLLFSYSCVTEKPLGVALYTAENISHQEKLQEPLPSSEDTVALAELPPQVKTLHDTIYVITENRSKDSMITPITESEPDSAVDQSKESRTDATGIILSMLQLEVDSIRSLLDSLVLYPPIQHSRDTIFMIKHDSQEDSLSIEDITYYIDINEKLAAQSDSLEAMKRMIESINISSRSVVIDTVKQFQSRNENVDQEKMKRDEYNNFELRVQQLEQQIKYMNSRLNDLSRESNNLSRGFTPGIGAVVIKEDQSEKTETANLRDTTIQYLQELLSVKSDSIKFLQDQLVFERDSINPLNLLEVDSISFLLRQDSLATQYKKELQFKSDSLRSLENKLNDAQNEIVRLDSLELTARFSSNARQPSNLEELGSKIQNNRIASIKSVFLSGYSDSSGSPDANTYVTQIRLEFLQQFLIDMGIDSRKIFLQNFGERYASEKIIESERRVEIVILYSK